MPGKTHARGGTHSSRQRSGCLDAAPVSPSFNQYTRRDVTKSGQAPRPIPSLQTHNRRSSSLLSQPTGHHGEKPSETLVRLIVERSLGVRACCYDDRDGNSKPDAIIHRQGGVPLAIVSDPHKADVQLLSALGKSTDAPSLRAFATATGCA